MDLFEACREGNLEKVKLILTEKSIYVHDKDGVTALMFAAKEGNMDIVTYLLSPFPSPVGISSIEFWKDNAGNTALMYAASASKNRDEMFDLLEIYIDVTIKNYNGETALDIYWKT